MKRVARYTADALARRRWAKPASPVLAGEVSCDRHGARAHGSNLPADGHNKPAVHIVFAGLVITLGRFNSLPPSVCGNARFVAYWLCSCVDGTGGTTM